MSRQQMIVIVDDNPELTLEELCEACNVAPDVIQEIIEYGIIYPEKKSKEKHFTGKHLQRVRTVVRLQHDLHVNLAGAALALDLMDELEEMRAQIELLKKYLEQR